MNRLPVQSVTPGRYAQLLTQLTNRPFSAFQHPDCVSLEFLVKPFCVFACRFLHFGRLGVNCTCRPFRDTPLCHWLSSLLLSRSLTLLPS